MLDLPLSERVNAGGGFVQDEDGRFLHQDAQQCHQLTLPHRKHRPAFPDDRVQTVRQGLQPFAIPNLARHRQDICFGHFRRGITDILGHRPGEQERHLRNNTQLPPVLLQVKGADIRSVDQYPPGLKLVEAGDQLRQRGFPRAGMADDGQVLAGPDGQAEVGQHRLVISISKRNVLEADFTFQLRHVPFIGLNHVRFGVHQGKDTLGSAQPGLDVGPESRKVHDRVEETPQAHDEQIPRADGDRSLCGAQSSRINQGSSPESG